MANFTPFLSFSDAILARIQEAGFQVAKSKELTLNKEQAAMFYQEHKDKEYFDSLCTSMSKSAEREREANRKTNIHLYT